MLGLFDEKHQIYTKDIYIDELTGALNRRFLNLIVDREIQRSKRYKHKFSIMIADLDNFKTINDTYGHLTGDSALRFFAKTIKDSLRSADSVIRYGGDEFIVILPNTDLEGAKNVGSRILSLLKEKRFNSINLSASIGVATFPEHGNSWDEVFQAADQALYTSKRLGKGRVSIPGGSFKNLILPTKYLVGRRDEASWIIARIQQRGMLHIVKGEVGIGKTRLVLETLKNSNAYFAYGRSMGPLKDVSYFLIRDFLSNLLKHHRDAVFSTFDKLPSAQKAEISKFMPDIFKQRVQKELSGDKYSLYEALIAFLNLIDIDNIIIVFDDLQWIDRESAEFVHYLIEKHLQKLTFFGIYRVEEVEKSPIHDVMTLLSRMRYSDELLLKPLTVEETGEMLQAALGAATSNKLKRIIFDETGGNPFFIEEILRKLYEEGWIYYVNNKWLLKENYVISPSQNIEQIVERKLHELSDNERLVLDYASVYGRELDAMILSRASRLNEGEVFDILDRLVRLNILKEGTVSDYVFMEGVIREIIENRLSRGKLKYYHKVVAKTIEELYAPTLHEHYEELVHHYEIAGDMDKTRFYAKLAGDKAFEVYAFEKALSYYEKAVEGLPPDDEVFAIRHKIVVCYKNLGRHRKAIAELEAIREVFKNKEFTIHEAIADSYIRLGEWLDAIENYKKSIEYAETEEDRHHVEVELAWALINLGKHGEAEEILNRAMEFFKNNGNEDHKKYMFIWIYTSLATIANMQQRHEEAVSYYREALRYSEELNHHYNIAVSLLNIGIALTSLGEMQEALENYNKSLELAKKDNYLYLVAVILQNMAHLHIQEGEYREALKTLLNLEQRFELMKNKFNLMLNYLSLSDTYYQMNELEKSLETAEKAKELSMESSLPSDVIYAKFNIARVATERGEYQKAIRILDSVSIKADEMPDKTIFPSLMENYARVFWKMGELEKAADYIEKAIAYHEKSQIPEFYRTDLYFFLAQIYFNLKKQDKATKYLDKALKTEPFIKGEFYKLTFKYEYAKTLLASGEKEKAREIFKELIPVFKNKGAERLVKEITQYADNA